MRRIANAVITVLLAFGMISGSMPIGSINANAAIGSDQKKKVYKAYADVLMEHETEILNYENKLKGYNSYSDPIGVEERQIALEDIDDDGIEELLFVARSDILSDGYEMSFDLYIYSYDRGAVKLYQSNIFTEAGGFSSYLVARTKDNRLSVARTWVDGFTDLEASIYKKSGNKLVSNYYLEAYADDVENVYTYDINGQKNKHADQKSYEQVTSDYAELYSKPLLYNTLKQYCNALDRNGKGGNSMYYEEALRYLGAQSKRVSLGEIISYGGHTYTFLDADDKDLDTYSEVEDYCRGLGGHLAVINNEQENAFLFRTLKNSFSKTAFFGYSDQDRESVWVWTGPSSDYENWTRYGNWYMPDNGKDYGGDEDYAEFNYERGVDELPNDGTWNDAPFRDNTDIFICEWESENKEEYENKGRIEVPDSYNGLIGMESVINAVLFACDIEELDTVETSVRNHNYFWDAMCTYCHSYPVAADIEAMNLPRVADGGTFQKVPSYILRNAAYAMFPDFNGTFPNFGDNTWRAIALDQGEYAITIADNISFATLRSWNLLDDDSIVAVYKTAYEDGTSTGSYEVHMTPNPNYGKEDGPETYYYTIEWIRKMD